MARRQTPAAHAWLGRDGHLHRTAFISDDLDVYVGRRLRQRQGMALHSGASTEVGQRDDERAAG